MKRLFFASLLIAFAMLSAQAQGIRAGAITAPYMNDKAALTGLTVINIDENTVLENNVWFLVSNYTAVDLEATIWSNELGVYTTATIPANTLHFEVPIGYFPNFFTTLENVRPRFFLKVHQPGNNFVLSMSMDLRATANFPYGNFPGITLPPARYNQLYK